MELRAAADGHHRPIMSAGLLDGMTQLLHRLRHCLTLNRDTIDFGQMSWQR
jgi:hypothetical protein